MSGRVRDLLLELPFDLKTEFPQHSRKFKDWQGEVLFEKIIGAPFMKRGYAGSGRAMLARNVITVKVVGIKGKTNNKY